MIREKRPGVWEVVVYLGQDPVTGRKQRLSRTARGTKKDAEKLERRLLVDLDNGDTARRRDTEATVGTLLESWLEHAAPELSPSTLHGYRRYARVHLEPGLGDVALSKLTTKRIDDFYRALRAPGAARYGRDLSPTTIHHVHAILRRALDQAVRWGWLEKNPADQASPPKLRRHEITPPEPGSLVRILTEAEKTDFAFGVIVWLAAVTGARRGELCALRWTKVDLQAFVDGEGRACGSVLIDRAIAEDDKGGLHEKDTKTHQARRISLDVATTQILEEHRARSDELARAFGAELPDDAYLFADGDPLGRSPLAPARLSSRWRRLCERLGVDVRLHDLRHFAATQALAAGVPLRTVAGRLGHGGGGRTTLSVYAHFLEASDRDAADQLGAVLQTARDARQEQLALDA